MIELLILENISRYMKDKKVIRISQQGFSKGKSRFTNWINFHNEMNGFVDEERAVDIGCLDFRKFSHKMLIDKLLEYGLDENTGRWIKSWLNGQAQRW